MRWGTPASHRESSRLVDPASMRSAPRPSIKADRAPGGVFGFEGRSLLLRRLVTAAYSGVVFSTFRRAS